MKETLRERVLNLEHAAKDALSHIRDELDEHLDGINSNTLEVQQVQDILSEFDSRMKKMEDKIDLLCHSILGDEQVSFAKLTTAEQEILYVLASSQTIRVALLAHKVGYSIRNLESHIQSMKQKGIPINFVEKSNQLCVCLATHFLKQIQEDKSIRFASRVAKQFS